MTVGNISNMSYIAPAGRVNSPSARHSSQISAPGAPALNPTHPSNRLFLSSDGDSAEISFRARGLSILDPDQQPVGPGIISNYPFDLPDPLLDWRMLNINPYVLPQGTATPAILPNAAGPDNGPSATTLGAVAENAYLEAMEPQGTCYTCENRKYVDQSNDSSVSFQTPTNISPNMAAAAVASHENEHVRNEQARADRDGREIVSQTVTLTYDTCPECGRHYVSGGTTRTTSISKSESDDMFSGESSDEGNN